MDYSALAASQETDEELKKHEQRESVLRFEKIDVSGTGIAVFCDTSMGTPRPFLIRPFRRAISTT